MKGFSQPALKRRGERNQGNGNYIGFIIVLSMRKALFSG